MKQGDELITSTGKKLTVTDVQTWQQTTEYELVTEDGKYGHLTINK